MKDKKAQPYIIPEDCDFGTVSHRFVDNECSPKIVDDDFRGVVINAPKEVFFEPGNVEPFGGFAFIPICGSFLGGSVNNERVSDILTLFAVNAVTKETYSGKHVEPGMSIPRPPPSRPFAYNPELPGSPEVQLYFYKYGHLPPRLRPPPPAEYRPAPVVTGGSFNFNLAEVLNLPEKPAEYIVYVTAGPIKSNVRTIEVKKKIK